mmetsp:Transcript_3558/g.8973  ORF Transcript_3558/g.8973 Transcript_3558/m.8973 type:complete len:248 (+) Transcript_3558:242-985(+)
MSAMSSRSTARRSDSSSHTRSDDMMAPRGHAFSPRTTRRYSESFKVSTYPPSAHTTVVSRRAKHACRDATRRPSLPNTSPALKEVSWTSLAMCETMLSSSPTRSLAIASAQSRLSSRPPTLKHVAPRPRHWTRTTWRISPSFRIASIRSHSRTLPTRTAWAAPAVRERMPPGSSSSTSRSHTSRSCPSPSVRRTCTSPRMLWPGLSIRLAVRANFDLRLRLLWRRAIRSLMTFFSRGTAVLPRAGLR